MMSNTPSTRLSSAAYELLNGRRCQLDTRHAALLAAVYTLSISILVVLLYSWRIGENTRDKTLTEVYYGVQIALFAIIGMQFALLILSVLLLVAITQERGNLIVPWIMGFITFISLEAVCIVYSNILREHVNKHFDSICKAEVAFFLFRLILNSLSITGVVKFYKDVRTGISWKEPEAIEV